ncbi:hypothetical protein, partial [Pedobacter heparinus]|uniref:beta strand repeat-containing protein n=1 Tax=Pedobacter heparinus TaxID=984 RepID=UPI00292D5C52
GSITGTAATVTNAAQPTITSVGTLTGLTVTNPISGSINGNAATATKLVTSRTINGVSFDGTEDVTIPVAAAGLTGTTLPASIVNSSLTSVGTLTELTVTNPITGNLTGSAATITNAAQPAITSVGTLTGLTVTNPIAGSVTGTAATVTNAAQPVITSVGTLIGLTVTNPIAGSVTGNAATATKLATSRTINGVSFDGTGNITIAAAASGLTGTALPATIISSSLTSVGTLTNLTVTNPIAGSITGNAATATTSSTVTTNANLTGEVNSTGNAATVTNAAVIGKVLTGLNTAAGTPAATDNILLAIGKLTGTNALKANLVSPALTGIPTAPTATPGTNNTQLATTAYADATASISVADKQNTLTNSAGLAGALSDETGTGSAVFAISPTLVTPNLGTPTTLIGTNITGTAAGLTAGNVSTNANLSGVVTSVGNATSIANGAITNVMLANGAVANLSGNNTGDQTATTVISTATGSITATNVQAAIAELDADNALKAPLASPSLTGTPISPTAVFGTNTTQLATTAFVQGATPTYARVTSSNATTSSTSLADITGLSLVLAASTTYEFEAVLSTGTSNVTTGTNYGVNLSNVTGASIEAQITGSATTTASKTLRITAFNTAASSVFQTISSQTGGVVIKGVIVTGTTAPTLTIKHLKVTSGTSTVYINSFLKVARIL